MNAFRWPTKPLAHISPHFIRGEFACRCCGRLYLDPLLLVTAEWLRALARDQPLYLNSAFRCEAHNKFVGGEKASPHLRGAAMDVWTQNLEELPTIARSIPYVTDTILYVRPELKDCFIHIGIGQVSRCHGNIDGRVCPITDAHAELLRRQGA